MEQKTEPLVSVKMITYNHAPYIAKAIDGVLMQETDFPFELVIGEDCSTDGTREIVFDYQKRYPQIIRVVTSEANVGMKANSRRVDAALRGKYIAWCEGDDYWHHPRKLQMQVDYLESHPECVLVYSDYDLLDTRSGRRIKAVVGREPVFPADELAVRLLLGECHAKTLTVCCRRQDVVKVKAGNPYEFSEHFLMGDIQLWVELSRLGSFCYIGEPLATAHILSESATQSRDPRRRIRFICSALEIHEHYIMKLAISDVTASHIRSRFYRTLLALAYTARDAQLASDMASALRHTGFQLSLIERLYVLGAQGGPLRAAIRALLYTRLQAARARRLIGFHRRAAVCSSAGRRDS